MAVAKPNENLFVLCAGPEEELCGECYSHHHQSEEYVGRATLTCSQTSYGVPSGDTIKNPNLHLTTPWVALYLVVLICPICIWTLFHQFYTFFV